MSHKHTPPGTPRFPRRLALVALLAGAGMIVLPSCGGGGGGGDTAGVDTGGTGAFSSGRISGFGSVIVNGVRYEDNAARIGDDDGDVVLGPNDLRLGMVVRVQAGAITAGSGDTLPSATATSITVESQTKGPVESKTAPDTLVVFGQTVKVDAATVFEEGLTFAAIAPGNILEVSGFADAAGVVTATRIERENNANEFKVRGTIANHDAAARTFTIGTAKFIYPTSARLPSAALQNGLFVRVRTQTVADANGNWVANRIDLRNAFEDRSEAEVEGILVSTGGVLSVNGITLDVSRLAAGAATALVGRRVEAEGQIVNGTLVVREIKLDDDAAEVDVRGTLADVNTTAQTFAVRGVTFHYSAQTRVDDGTIAVNLVNGATVRVRGSLPAVAGAPIEATRIDFRP
jgi:hypothetical protein